MLNRAGQGDQVWNIYSPYNPIVIQLLLNIWRVFYNLSKPGKDGKTPAMRLGLSSGPVDVVRIINHRPAASPQELGALGSLRFELWPCMSLMVALR